MFIVQNELCLSSFEHFVLPEDVFVHESKLHTIN